MNQKKRRVLIVCAVVTVVCAWMCSYAVADGGEVKDIDVISKLKSAISGSNRYEGVIRFHVRANSNSAADQELKLIVRDAVLAEVNSILEEETVARFDARDLKYVETSASRSTDGTTAVFAATAELPLSDVREIIDAHRDELASVAKSVIVENGYDYDVEVNLGIEAIPRKTYGDVTFPAGNYEALTINIGDAAGENWWCVLFPPLCIIDPSGESLEGIETDSVGRGRSAIKLKFKSLEILDAITD